MDVNHKGLKTLVSEYRKIGKPIFVEGATGIGKSEAIKKDSQEFAGKSGRIWKDWNGMTKEEKISLLQSDEVKRYHIFVDVRTALLEPTDLMGMPVLNGSTYVEWKPTLLFKVLSNKEVSATVFFDEFNLGSRMVQNSSYQIILDKAIGETKLGNDVFIIAAGNRAEDKANIIETPAPLNNRFGHCTLMIPTVDDWTEYNLSSEYADARIVSFLKFKPQYIHSFKPNLKEKAFSSPRALHELAMLINGKDENKQLDVMSVLAKSKCGEAFGVEFQAFLKLSRKIDINDILKNPEKVKEITGLDLKYSLISGVATKCKQDWKNTIDPALKVCKYLEDEYGIFLLRMVKELVGQGKFNNYVMKSQIWDKELSDKFEGLLGGWN